MPLIAPILGLDPEAGYVAADAEGRKLTEDIAKAAVEYVLACLGDGPALLVVEDHHDVDEATNDLISRILESGRPQTFVLATSRTIPAIPFAAHPAGPACARRLSGAGGRHRAPRPLARHWIAASSWPAATASRCFSRSSFGAASHEPVDVGTARRVRPASTVPDVLYEPLMARLYTSPATVAVASAAATIGREVDLGLLAQSVELAPQDVREAVGESDGRTDPRTGRR